MLLRPDTDPALVQTGADRFARPLLADVPCLPADQAPIVAADRSGRVAVEA